MKKPVSNHVLCGADLDLQAVRYITGEMLPLELEAFEMRLAEDQAARESVERAVQIGIATVRSAPALRVADSAPELEIPAVAGRSGLRWAAAAALLIGLGVTIYLAGGFGRGTAADPIAPAVNDAVVVDQELMDGWTDSHDLFEDGEMLADSAVDRVVDSPLDAAFPEPSEWVVEVLTR